MPDDEVGPVDAPGEGLAGRVRNLRQDREPRPVAGVRKQASGAQKRKAAAARRAATSSGGDNLPSLRTELEVTYRLLATAWSMRDPVCGNAALDAIPGIVDAWDAWASSNPQVHRYLSMVLAGGGPIGIIAAHLPLVTVMVQHHGPKAQQQQHQARADIPPSPAAAGMPAGMVDANGYDADGIYWGKPSEPIGDPYAVA